MNKYTFISRGLSEIKDREICCYSISCKERENIGNHYSILLYDVINYNRYNFAVAHTTS